MNKKNTSKVFLIMGVSSTGKSSIGSSLAQKINAKFIDGDDLHPKANIIKMASGKPLNDNDRKHWLERIRDVVFSIGQKNEMAVIVCSALKKKYRTKIREGNENILFLHLYGEFELVKKRMLARNDHFMPVDLLRSQYDTLEMPSDDEKDIVTIDIDEDFSTIVTRCLDHINNLNLLISKK